MKKKSTLLFLCCFLFLKCFPNPVISVSPSGNSWYSINLGNANYGTNSTVVSYTLSASGLSPSDGNISLGCTYGIEASFDGVNFLTINGYINIPYTAGTLAPMTVYVRSTTTAPPGNYIGELQHSGGGASMAVVEADINVVATYPVIVGLPESFDVGVSSPGIPSTLTSYSIWASGLSPSSGNIMITPGSYIEISIDGINFTSSVLAVPYTNGEITPETQIYLRSSGTCPQFHFVTQIMHSGGGASAIVTTDGYVSWDPAISAPSNIDGLITSPAAVSVSQQYTLSARALIGNAVVTITPSAYLEVSTDNINFSSAPISIPTVLDEDSIPATPIYVRISAGASPGNFTGTITHHDIYNSGPDAITNVTGMVVSPLISAGGAITGLTTVAGSPSTSGAYILSADNLIPAAGNLTVTPGSFLQVSLDNINFSPGPLQVAYTNSSLAATSVYVRMDGNATTGSFSETITNAGGGAADAIVNVSGETTTGSGRINIGPNPANNTTTIFLPGNTALTYLNIMDFNGRIVRTISTRGSSVPVSVSELTKGIYTINIIRDRVLIESRRLIVN